MNGLTTLNTTKFNPKATFSARMSGAAFSAPSLVKSCDPNPKPANLNPIFH